MHIPPHLMLPQDKVLVHDRGDAKLGVKASEMIMHAADAKHAMAVEPNRYHLADAKPAPAVHVDVEDESNDE